MSKKQPEPLVTTQEFWTPELLAKVKTKKKGTVVVKPIKGQTADEVPYDLSLSNNDFDIVAKVVVDSPGTNEFGHSFVWLPARSSTQGNYDLRANVPADAGGKRLINLAYRGIAKIDCGFSVKLPPRFRLATAVKESLADRGIINLGLATTERLVLKIANIGKEIVAIKHGDVIAEVWVEEVRDIIWEQ